MIVCMIITHNDPATISWEGMVGHLFTFKLSDIFEKFEYPNIKIKPLSELMYHTYLNYPEAEYFINSKKEFAFIHCPNIPLYRESI